MRAAAAAVIVVLTTTCTQPPPVERTTSPESDEVRSTVESYYQAFSDRDWERFGEHFWPGATLTTTWTPPGEESERVVATTIPDFIAQAPAGPGSREIFEELPNGSRDLESSSAGVGKCRSVRFPKFL